MRRRHWEFYYHNAGRAFRPGAQAEFMTAAVAAVEMARAVQWAWEASMYFVWEEDPDGAEVQLEDGQWVTLPAVSCALVRSNEEHSETCASLCGITESDNAAEARDYRDVVEAELASEALREYVLEVRS